MILLDPLTACQTYWERRGNLLGCAGRHRRFEQAVPGSGARQPLRRRGGRHDEPWILRSLFDECGFGVRGKQSAGVAAVEQGLDGGASFLAIIERPVID